MTNTCASVVCTHADIVKTGERLLFHCFTLHIHAEVPELSDGLEIVALLELQAELQH